MIKTAKEFAFLTSSDDQATFRRAAVDCAPIEVWLEIIEHYPDLRKIVAHNKPIPIEILEILSKDPDVDVRIEVAHRRKLTPELFWQLATDEDDSVRGSIAGNAKALEEVLEFLAKNDREEWVRSLASEQLEKKRRKNAPNPNPETI